MQDLIWRRFLFVLFVTFNFPSLSRLSALLLGWQSILFGVLHGSLDGPFLLLCSSGPSAVVPDGFLLDVSLLISCCLPLSTSIDRCERLGAAVSAQPPTCALRLHMVQSEQQHQRSIFPPKWFNINNRHFSFGFAWFFFYFEVECNSTVWFVHWDQQIINHTCRSNLLGTWSVLASLSHSNRVSLDFLKMIECSNTWLITIVDTLQYTRIEWS